ncbi:DUF4279 domain-containing protein [Neisseria sp.]|uniref:DUF4279 domain-containing protein n=1 Tax=Neisseria sp. TaxID=192066 RepID=UPI0026DB1D80|nr:DUF4279 domain-containing protein [Neisseria sp.]MDO4907525.1 DUF4279 domain-containing protein [Neisseria sp.]
MYSDKTQINIDFSIVGDFFETDLITEKLGVIPTEILKKGELLESRRLPNIETVWSYQTGIRDSFDLEEQFSIIFNLFESKKDVIKDLCKQYNLKVYLQCYISILNDETPIIHLDNRSLNFISEIGADIDIDISI